MQTKKQSAHPLKKLHGAPHPAEMMWVSVYKGPGQRSFEKKAKPVIQVSTDAVVKVMKTTICGTDLHILKGDVPEVEPATATMNSRKENPVDGILALTGNRGVEVAIEAVGILEILICQTIYIW